MPLLSVEIRIYIHAEVRSILYSQKSLALAKPSKIWLMMYFSSKTAKWLSKFIPDCVRSGRTWSKFLTSLYFYFLNL